MVLELLARRHNVLLELVACLIEGLTVALGRLIELTRQILVDHGDGPDHRIEDRVDGHAQLHLELLQRASILD
jgi:hypothetical protein